MPQPKFCSKCGKQRDHHGAKGLCHGCYERARYAERKLRTGGWSQKYPACTLCGESARPHAGHGFCYRCNARKNYDPITHRLYIYRHKLKTKYKISMTEYNEMLTAQDGVCAICRKRESRLVKEKNAVMVVQRLSVDHDHKTGKIRGLLCSKCNRALGYFDDCLENLAAAFAYLREHKSEESAKTGVLN